MNQLLDEKLFDSISQQAKDSPRLRMNYNLHDNLDAKAQRLFNAVEPGTVFPIHRHLHSSETQFIMRGHAIVTTYDNQKNLTATYDLDPRKGRYGVHLDIGVWHSLEVLESGTIVFEVKDGPYTPITPDNILP
ncbi:MAG: WbuC family cupin fold metalloprotein [Bacteroidaceae bacterium]|nr:WbuC family cupin fold metalloprotein [Bacteroidaceae bacterium]